MIVIVVIAAIVIPVAEKLGHGSPAGSEILIPQYTYDSISPGQYSGVAFIAHSAGVLNASYSDQYGVIFYVMTPDEYEHLVITNNVSGYSWTLGQSGYVALAYMTANVPAGDWWFAMANPNPAIATAVGFQSALTFTPS